MKFYGSWESRSLTAMEVQSGPFQAGNGSSLKPEGQTQGNPASPGAACQHRVQEPLVGDSVFARQCLQRLQTVLVEMKGDSHPIIF
jgi:hypothetical protein